jgi:formate dehydrogenase major subunit
MEVNRREFLKASGAGVGGVFLLGALSPDVALARSPKIPPLRKKVGEKTTICPYDASGCGFIVAAEDGRVRNIEGDPDHPINRGGGCSKGAAMRQLSAENPWRVKTVQYRRPGGADWEEVSWDWALQRIAANIKRTRDTNWTTRDDQNYVVNRTDGIASVGGAALDNEECYLLVKMLRSLGMVYVEHQARI